MRVSGVPVSAVLVCLISCWLASGGHEGYAAVVVEGDTSRVSLESWSGTKRSWLVTKPGGTERKLHVLEGLFGSSELARVLEEASMATFETKADSVDQRPTYELYAVYRGRVEQQPLADLLAPLVETRLLPHVQQTYNCSECSVCHILLRRYRSGERLDHPNHFDEMAFVTAVADLDFEAHTGGLYVQTGPQVRSRWFVPLGNGSVAFHQYDLDHGVEVSEGHRTSLVFWINTDQAACELAEAPWYMEAVQAGDADAQANLAGCYARGTCGVPHDPERSMSLYRMAAEQGHWQAQCALAGALQAGWGVKRDEIEARRWYKVAADLGYALAQRRLGEMYESGAGGPQDFTSAASSYRRAAKQDDAEAQFRLAWAYMFGQGVAKADAKQAIRWMKRAANAGHAAAIGTMGDAYRMGSGVDKDHRKARHWYKRALATTDDTVRENAEKSLKHLEL